ncbi:MAG: DMT family transporter [Alkalispirochaetaceae bacterium]
MNMPRHARVIVVLAVAFTSVSAILIRLSDSHPLTLASYRMLFSFLFIAPFSLGSLKGIGRRDLLLAGASGLFLALHFATWVSGVRLTSVASATVLVSMHPVVVVAGSALFLREPLKPVLLLLILSAVAGTVILSIGELNSGVGDLRGNLLALAGAVSVGGYMLIGSALRKRVGAGAYNTLVYAVCAAALFLLSLLWGAQLRVTSGREYLLFLSLAFFCTILGHALFNWALRYVRATFVSTSILLEPLFATIMAIFVLDEIPSYLTLVGGVVVILSLRGVSREERKEQLEVSG